MNILPLICLPGLLGAPSGPRILIATAPVAGVAGAAKPACSLRVQTFDTLSKDTKSKKQLGADMATGLAKRLQEHLDKSILVSGPSSGNAKNGTELRLIVEGQLTQSTDNGAFLCVCRLYQESQRKGEGRRLVAQWAGVAPDYRALSSGRNEENAEGLIGELTARLSRQVSLLRGNPRNRLINLLAHQKEGKAVLKVTPSKDAKTVVIASHLAGHLWCVGVRDSLPVLNEDKGDVAVAVDTEVSLPVPVNAKEVYILLKSDETAANPPAPSSSSKVLESLSGAGDDLTAIRLLDRMQNEKGIWYIYRIDMP